MKLLIVQLDRQYRVLDNDALCDLYDVLERNRDADCTLPKATIMAQTLDIAKQHLRGQHLFLATFRKSNESVMFYQITPLGVTVDAMANACRRNISAA